MSQHGFYNANQYRAYPFITPALRPGAGDLSAPAALSNRLIVDCHFLCALPARNFTSDDPSVVYAVYLHKFSRDGTTLTFEFRGDAPGLADYPLVFTRDITDPEYAISYNDTDTPESMASSDSLDCADPDVWEGFLVTGDLSQHGLTDGQTITFADTDWLVEPSLVQNLSYLNSVSLANYDRARYVPDDDCLTSESSAMPHESIIYPGTRCLNGDLRLKEGWNIDIRQDTAANRITISAAVGAGAGRGCEPPAIYADETPPVGSKLLGGGPACDELITSINGISGRSIMLRAGAGFSVLAEPADNSLEIGVDLTQFAAACAADTSSESSVGGA